MAVHAEPMEVLALGHGVSVTVCRHDTAIFTVTCSIFVTVCELYNLTTIALLEFEGLA